MKESVHPLEGFLPVVVGHEYQRDQGASKEAEDGSGHCSREAFAAALEKHFAQDGDPELMQARIPGDSDEPQAEVVEEAAGSAQEAKDEEVK